MERADPRMEQAVRTMLGDLERSGPEHVGPPVRCVAILAADVGDLFPATVDPLARRRRRAGASRLASRLRIPGLVVVLGVGMAIGSDGAGWIHFVDYRLAETIGIIALALILFEGGLAAGFGEIRPVLGPAISLAIVGTLITAVIAGLAAAWLFDLDIVEGLLVGSIVASTDSAAIFALLRGSTLSRRVARTLEGESGLNDPVAALLVLGFIDWIQKPHYGVGDMAVLFARQMGIGLVVGVVIGVLAVGAMRRVRLASAGLYPVASMAAAAL